MRKLSQFVQKMITENLEKFLIDKKMPASALEKALGLGNGTLSKAIKNKKSIGSDIVEKIFSYFPQLNPDWLISGEGNIYRGQNIDQEEDFEVTNKKPKFDEAEDIGEIRSYEEKEHIYQIGNNQFIDMGGGRMQMFVPLVEQYAYAGYLSGWADAEYIEELPKISIIVDSHHKGTYRSFTVKGDSMDDNSRSSICEGDIAVGRKVEKQYWTSKLHISKWKTFAIVHEDGIIIKDISEHDVENGIITCVSLNPDKDFYPTRKIHLKDVYELYNVIQVIRNI